MLLILAKLGIFRILKFFAILVFGVLMGSLISNNTQSEQKVATKARRSLGIGYIGLAHYLAKQGVSYGDPKAWKLVHDLTEAFQYYLAKSTVNLAKEKGYVNILIVLNILTVYFQSILTKQMLTN